MNTMITTEFVKTSCPKVSFSDLFAVAVIVGLSGRVALSIECASKVAANVLQLCVVADLEH